MNKKTFLVQFGEKIRQVEEGEKIDVQGIKREIRGENKKIDEEKHYYKKARIYLEEVLNLINESLSKGESVSFLGWGKWEIYNRRARNRKSLQTGEIVMHPSKKAVRFKLGKELKNSIASK